MATKVVVPEMGESIVEATVGTWLKHEGDQVTAGEGLVELVEPGLLAPCLAGRHDAGPVAGRPGGPDDQ